MKNKKHVRRRRRRKERILIERIIVFNILLVGVISIYSYTSLANNKSQALDYEQYNIKINNNIESIPSSIVCLSEETCDQPKVSLLSHKEIIEEKVEETDDVTKTVDVEENVVENTAEENVEFKKETEEVTDKYVIKFTENERYNLERLVYAEAGNQTYEGMVATAAVVVNRVKSDNFDNTIQTVIDSPHQFTKYTWVKEEDLSSELIDAVDEALCGGDPLYDYIGVKALFFHSVGGYGHQGKEVMSNSMVRINDQYYYHSFEDYYNVI